MFFWRRSEFPTGYVLKLRRCYVPGLELVQFLSYNNFGLFRLERS